MPHSEICGSKGARPSPQLIAACYVLHRLCVPRHPPDALALTLDRSAFVPCPETKPAERPALPENGIHAISLECRIKINRSCKPANPAFTMSMILRRTAHARTRLPFLEADCFRRELLWHCSLQSPYAKASGDTLRRGRVRGLPPEAAQQRRVVEPDGIEPTTSCLQSTRSPS